jgi:hypothetical protein
METTARSQASSGVGSPASPAATVTSRSAIRPSQGRSSTAPTRTGRPQRAGQGRLGPVTREAGPPGADEPPGSHTERQEEDREEAERGERPAEPTTRHARIVAPSRRAGQRCVPAPAARGPESSPGSLEQALAVIGAAPGMRRGAGAAGRPAQGDDGRSRPQAALRGERRAARPGAPPDRPPTAAGSSSGTGRPPARIGTRGSAPSGVQPRAVRRSASPRARA